MKKVLVGMTVLIVSIGLVFMGCKGDTETETVYADLGTDVTASHAGLIGASGASGTIAASKVVKSGNTITFTLEGKAGTTFVDSHTFGGKNVAGWEAAESGQDAAAKVIAEKAKTVREFILKGLPETSFILDNGYGTGDSAVNKTNITINLIQKNNTIALGYASDHLDDNPSFEDGEDDVGEGSSNVKLYKTGGNVYKMYEDIDEGAFTDNNFFISPNDGRSFTLTFDVYGEY
jgi:hypothetical protein